VLKMPKKKIICLALSILCMLAYLNTLDSHFVADDIPAITMNPELLFPWRFWMEPASLLNSLNLLIAGHNPFTYHLTSVLLHALNTILAFFFLSIFFGLEPSFLGALIFAVHPIHTEAVSWISGKPYLILFAFTLGNTLLYQRAVKEAKRLRPIAYLFVLLIFYYMTIRYYTYYLFPFLLILLDLTLERARRNWRLWLPFFILAGIRFAGLRVALYNRASFMDSLGAETIKSYIYAIYSFYSHLWLLLWPQKLTLFHEIGPIPVSIFKYGLLSLIPVLFSLFFAFKKARELFLGLGIFIIFLSPTYSPIPLSSLIAERYIYLPSLSLSVFMAYLYQRYTNKDARLRKYLVFIMIAIISAYTVRTIFRNEDWRNPERFWAQVARLSVNNWQAHSNMGFIYLTKGRLKEAINEYEKAIRLYPKSADLYNNLAVAYHKAGKVAEAEYYFQKALEVNPDSAYAHINLAIIYCRQSKSSLAIQHYDKAVRLGYKNIPQELLEKLKP